jgi:hypothetical protein
MQRTPAMRTSVWMPESEADGLARVRERRHARTEPEALKSMGRRGRREDMHVQQRRGGVGDGRTWDA